MSRSAFVTFIEVEQHDVHLSQLRNVLQLDWCQAFASSSRNAQILAQPNTYLYFGNGLLSFALRKTKLQTIPAGEDIHVIIYCNFYCLCKWWKHILRISGNWIKVIGGQRSWGTPSTFIILAICDHHLHISNTSRTFEVTTLYELELLWEDRPGS